jgi:hypothetical protein
MGFIIGTKRLPNREEHKLNLLKKLVRQAYFVLGKTKILGIFTHQEFLLFRFNLGNFVPNRLLSSVYFHFGSADVIIATDRI